MQTRYEATSPAASRTVRVLGGLAIASALGAAWMTAGPGNGWQPPRERVAVTLPAVTVTGHRALAGADAPVAACERQDRTASRAARKTA